MKRLVETADRLAEPSMRLLGRLNLVFLALFYLALLFAASQAHAEPPACKGIDLSLELAADKPAEMAKIEAEAAAVPNGQGTLWKIEKDGLEPSWLLGTMHTTDPRVTSLTDRAQAAFDGAKTVVIETTDILDKRKMMAQLGQEPELMMYTGGETLTSDLSPQDKAMLEAGLQARGIPLAAVIKMKPWMLASMLGIPACEVARQAAGVEVLDVKLGMAARQDSKELLGLETASEQFRAMASLPMEQHLHGLVETVRFGDRIDDVMETMVQLYERENIALFMPVLQQALGESVMDGYGEFNDVMIVKRNSVMVERAQPMLANGGVFMAVGALHLIGEQGVVELLRAKGYKLMRPD